MKTDEKITLWSERIHEFQSSGQTCKTWCQEHHVPVSTMNYWMHKLKTLDGQSDTDMILQNANGNGIFKEWDFEHQPVSSPHFYHKRYSD